MTTGSGPKDQDEMDLDPQEQGQAEGQADAFVRETENGVILCFSVILYLFTVLLMHFSIIRCTHPLFTAINV